ncbi:hypothetical protein [Clostridium sp.]|uniref:hypothetical protein n=1 Tax=Clostridium sp. TaxID=1506 RepID=UPI003464CCBC
MKKIFKNKFVKTLLLLCAFVSLVSFPNMKKAEAASRFNLTGVGEAINTKEKMGWELWVANKFQPKSFDNTIDVASKDVAIKYEMVDELGMVYIEVDGVSLGRTNIVEDKKPIRMISTDKYGKKYVETIVVKDLPAGNHKITLRCVYPRGGVQTDFVNINVIR